MGSFRHEREDFPGRTATISRQIALLNKVNITEEQKQRDPGVSDQRHFPNRPRHGAFGRRLVRDQIETAKPAKGISIGLFATVRTGDHGALLSAGLFLMLKLFTTDANDQK